MTPVSHALGWGGFLKRTATWWPKESGEMVQIQSAEALRTLETGALISNERSSTTKQSKRPICSSSTNVLTSSIDHPSARTSVSICTFLLRFPFHYCAGWSVLPLICFYFAPQSSSLRASPEQPSHLRASSHHALPSPLCSVYESCHPPNKLEPRSKVRQ